MTHKKFGPDRFSRFDVYWIQTNKQTDKPNLYIDWRLSGNNENWILIFDVSLTSYWIFAISDIKNK